MKSRLVRCLFLLLALSPALLPLWQILHCGVDIPFMDTFDDDLAGLHVKAHAGELTFADLAAQHNEHRIIIPRLVFLGLGRLTGGNAIAEMLAGWTFAVATSFVLLRLGRTTQPPAATASDDGQPRPLLWWFLANLLIFSPAQWENWLWGIGVQNFMPMLWTALAILAAAAPVRDTAKLALVVAGAALATWSSGNGALAWGLAGGVLLWAPTWREFLSRRRLALILLGAVALAAALYCIGLNPPNHRGAQPYDSTLAAKLHYTLLFAGSPFAFALNARPALVATGLGAVLHLLLAACAVRFLQVWLRDRDIALCRRTLPWFAVAGFSVGSGLIAAWARAGIGAEQAISSRYVTFALYLPVALIPLVPALKPWLLFRRPGTDVQTAESRTAPIAATIGATVLIVLALAAIDPALRTSESTRNTRRQARAATVLSTLLPGHPLITAFVFPDSALVQRVASGLDDIGYLRPRLVRSSAARTLAVANPPPAENCGRLEQAWEIGPGEIALAGWASLPAPDRQADVVLLCVTDAQGEPQIVEMAPVGSPRPDKAAALGEPAATCGWALRAPIGTFLGRQTPATVTAWAFDAEHRELFPLAGTVTLGR